MHQLRLCGVLRTLYSRRHGVVYRHFLGVLLKAHRTHRHLARCRCRVCEVLFIHAPFTPYEVEVGETQHDRLLETVHEHTHEAHTREVIDCSHLVFVFSQWYSELIPSGVSALSVAQRGRCLALVDDEVAAHLKVFRAYRDVILIVFLILVQREVLIDVFYIGSRFI